MVHTYLAIRENDVTLYGFFTKDEKELITCLRTQEEKTISVPNTVQIIREYAIYKNGNLTTLSLPSNLKMIEPIT